MGFYTAESLNPIKDYGVERDELVEILVKVCLERMLTNQRVTKASGRKTKVKLRTLRNEKCFIIRTKEFILIFYEKML